MNFLRRHWATIGLFISIGIGIKWLVTGCDPNKLAFITGLHFFALLLHQFEEYKFPGSFPRMFNSLIFKSGDPDRYPLNSHSALIINAVFGWSLYFLGTIIYEVLWFNIALFVVTISNCIAHLVVFNVRLRTFYNAGMATSLLLFLPTVIYFFYFIRHLATLSDYVGGLLVGGMMGGGILFCVLAMKRKDSPFRFEGV